MTEVKLGLLLLVVVTISALSAEPSQDFPSIDLCHGQQHCFASVSNNTSITCTAKGVNPLGNSVEWFQNTSLAEIPLTSSKFNTSVDDTFVSVAKTNVVFNDDSLLEQYICKSSNSSGMQIAIVLLKSNYPWTFNDSVTGQLKQRIVLNCGDFDESLIVWQKQTDSGEYDTLAYRFDGSYTLTKNDFNLSSNGSLIIPTLTLSNEGNYVCIYRSLEQQGYKSYSLDIDGPHRPDDVEESSTLRMWIIILIIIITGVSIVLILLYIRKRKQKHNYSDQLQARKSREKRDTWNKGAGFVMNYEEPPTITDEMDIESNQSDIVEEHVQMSTFLSTSKEDVENTNSSKGEDDVKTDFQNEEDADGSRNAKSIDTELKKEDVESVKDFEDNYQNSKPKAVVTEISYLNKPQDVLELGSLIIILLETSLKSFTWEGKEVQNYEKGDFKPFFGVPFDEMLYVSDRGSKSIVKFDKRFNRLADFGKEHLAEPGGLTVSPTNEHLFILNGKDLPNAGISVFSLDGNYMKDITLRDLVEPWFIKCNTRNELVVSEINSKKVKIYDSEKGKLIDSFSGNLDGAPMYSRGLALDKKDNIYISLRAPGLRSQMECIVKYNSQGFQLKKYLESPPANQTFKKFWKSVPLGRHIDGIAEDVLAVGRKSKGLDFATALYFVEQWDEEYLLVVDTGNRRVLIVQLTMHDTVQF